MMVNLRTPPCGLLMVPLQNKPREVRSDCLLKPVFVTKDPQRKNAYLVMCEVLNADGTPHESNGRAIIEDDDNDFWFGFEQEYFLWNPETDSPIGFPEGGFPRPQGHTIVQSAQKTLMVVRLLKNILMPASMRALM